MVPSRPDRDPGPPMPLSLEQSRRLRPLAGLTPGSLLVHEIYKSLQGEGTLAGLPCTFIRLTACHLRCVYCDTPHAFTQGRSLTQEAILQRVRELGCPLVELTGGEPLVQPESFPLMSRLADAGYTVLLETAGACDTARVDPRVKIILDVKTPGSGEAGANVLANLVILKPADEVKFVVCDRADFDWSVELIRRHDLTRRVPVLIAAVHDRVAPADLAAWILATGLPLRLQLQLHKIIWEPQARGV